MDNNVVELIMALMVKYRIDEVEIQDPAPGTSMKFVKRSHSPQQEAEQPVPKKSFKVPSLEELINATPGGSKGPTDFDKFKATNYLKDYNSSNKE